MPLILLAASVRYTSIGGAFAGYIRSKYGSAEHDLHLLIHNIEISFL